MEHPVIDPHPWMILPFVALLATIAIAPLLFAAWWNRHYPKVVCALGAITLVYYLFDLNAHERVLHTAVEYISFIALIGSLFIVSGGIHINVKGEATPFANVVFLLIGAVIANVLGTTGASMLLIRPWLRMNRYRITAHHVVFFIFIVSNIGGCLTPIGDPPLFLGYLKGIPFWWVAEHCWPIWAVGVALMLAIFYVIDRRNYRRAPKEVRERLAEPHDIWRFEGLANLFFLAVILGAVFVNSPRFLREAIMTAAAIGSYLTTRRQIHEANHFNFHPIREVAILFAGIFATMMPALDLLRHGAAKLANTNIELFSPTLFFWGSGAVSSVLDNAPTYLSFLEAEIGAFVTPETAAQIQQQFADLPGALHPEISYLLSQPKLAELLLAISIGAVFFGANTYIGNGPNFMVKAIADQQKVHTPTFLGYVFKYTLPYMFPMLLIVWWIFFRS
jgi:Na+/H+ antiporter NhaD/arsenite permease-like protein